LSDPFRRLFGSGKRSHMSSLFYCCCSPMPAFLTDICPSCAGQGAPLCFGEALQADAIDPRTLERCQVLSVSYSASIIPFAFNHRGTHPTFFQSYRAHRGASHCFRWLSSPEHHCHAGEPPLSSPTFVRARRSSRSCRAVAPWAKEPCSVDTLTGQPLFARCRPHRRGSRECALGARPHGVLAPRASWASTAVMGRVDQGSLSAVQSGLGLCESRMSGPFFPLQARPPYRFRPMRQGLILNLFSFSIIDLN
jgi:hypothetical protein